MSYGEGVKGFPKGRDRKTLLRFKGAATRRKAELLLKGGKPWTFIDSPLEVGRNSFQSSFEQTLPNGETSLRRYLETALANKERRLGIEFGGPASKLFGGFSNRFFAKTAGVTLADHRKDRNSIAADKERNHTVLIGNILSASTYDTTVQEWLGNEKVDVIFERLLGGLNLVPGEPYALSKVLSQWYTLLADGGIIFAEVPLAVRPLFRAWADMIRRDYGEVLEIENAPVEDGYGPDCDVMRLRKLEGAPLELPLFTPREVERIAKDQNVKFWREW